jgi:hypothetical protein
MHHLEMEANEAGSEGQDAPEELGPAPGANGTTSVMPPSPAQCRFHRSGLISRFDVLGG